MGVEYPVHQWNPPFCGKMDLRIDVKGVWYHNGSPIHRHSLRKLFSKIMRREADGVHYLLTPTEKWSITVDDTPLRIVDFRQDKNDLTFISDMDDEVMLSKQHPLRIDSGPAPTILVRHHLEARLSRNVFYHLVDLAYTHTEAGQHSLLLESGGLKHNLGSY